MHRNPSHFGSWSRPSGTSAGIGICLTDLASIGFTGGITGRRTTERYPLALERGHTFRRPPARRTVPAVVRVAPARRRTAAGGSVGDVVDPGSVVQPHVGTVVHLVGVAGQCEHGRDDRCGGA